jgi:hypothetical protein
MRDHHNGIARADTKESDSAANADGAFFEPGAVSSDFSAAKPPSKKPANANTNGKIHSLDFFCNCVLRFMMILLEIGRATFNNRLGVAQI